MRRLALLAALTVSALTGVVATATPAGASSQEQYGYNWNVGRYGVNNIQIGMIYNGALLQYEVGNVGRSAIRDAWTIEIESPALVHTYGPYYVAAGAGVGVVPYIGEYLAAPGYWLTVQYCEYAVACHDMTLTLFGILNTN